MPDCKDRRNHATSPNVATPAAAFEQDAAMTRQTPPAEIGPARTEAEMVRDPDAIAGRAMVERRVALCTPEEQAAFWEAVRRCFGGPAPGAAGA